MNFVLIILLAHRFEIISISDSTLCIDRQNEPRNSVKVDTMYDLLNELVKQIAKATTRGNYTNSSILFKLPK